MAASYPRMTWPRPAPALWAALVAWSFVGLAASGGWVGDRWWWAAGLVLALLAGVDARRLWRMPTPDVERRIPDTWPIGVERAVTLMLRTTAAVQRVDVFDLHPGGWAVRGLPRRLSLHAQRETRLDYHVRAPARGDFHFEGVHLRLASPWRCWTQRRTAGSAQPVRVFPNFAPLARFALFSAEQASRLVGAHLKRRRGEGTDFHQMREYRVGDSLRQVDWKATARSRRLISREYQDERNQQVVLLLDTGRRLMARDHGASHFDHVLDAALVVAYLALRQGDSVGLLASGGDETWVPPRRGVGAIEALLRASYALQPRPVATDFVAAAATLAAHQRRRALVMLVTNLGDEDVEDVLAAVALLRKRHLVCVASLRERALDAALEGEVHDLQDALRAGAAAHYLQQRQAAHDALAAQGVAVLDVACDGLAASLVERYLSIKRGGLL